MWWEPSSENEQKVSGAVRTLQSWFRRDSEGRAFAVGSVAVSEDGTLAPFVMIPKDRRIGELPYGTPFDLDGRILDSNFPTLGMPLIGMVTERPRLKRVGPAGARATDIVHEIISAHVRVRDLIAAERSDHPGTASVLAWDRNTEMFGLLTAGHVVGGRGVGVEKVRKLFGFTLARHPLGRVAHHEEPSPGMPAGWDIAFIRPAVRLAMPERIIAGTTARSFSRPERVFVHGAKSGLVTQATVRGALTDIEFEEEPRRAWANCWLIAPSGVLRGGDSGAAVFMKKDGSLLGLYVGASDLGGVPQEHYVQDAQSLQDNVLNSWGIDLLPLGRAE